MANMKLLFTTLMDAGADGSAGWRGCHGRTLLGAAAYGRSDEMVLALLKSGAKDDMTVQFGGHSGSRRSMWPRCRAPNRYPLRSHAGWSRSNYSE